MTTRRGERGFTILEVLVAVGIMAIAMAGVLGLMKVSTSGSGYSRRATEAAILAEDKIEWLRTVPIATLDDGTDTVDAAGVPADVGFTRAWTLTPVDGVMDIVVTVTWDEGDGAHTTTLRTLRAL